MYTAASGLNLCALDILYLIVIMYYKGRSFRVYSKWCFISVYDSDASVVCHRIVKTKILAIMPLSVLILLMLLVSFITIMFPVYFTDTFVFYCAFITVLDCVTQCSQSAAHLCKQFLHVQQIGFVTLGPLRCAQRRMLRVVLL